MWYKLPVVRPHQFIVVQHFAAVEAVRKHEALGVGLQRDEGLDVSVLLDEGGHVFNLNLRKREGPGEPAGAGVYQGKVT